MKFEMNPKIEEAWTIPSAFYTDEGIYELGKDRIFGRSWQFVTWEDSVRVPGSVYPVTLLPG